MANRLRTPLFLITALLAVVLAGCGGGDKSSAKTSATSTAASAEPATTRPQKPIEGRFDVGDHKLWIHCVGGGSPTIVYIHPFAADDSSAGGGDAGLLPDLLRERH